MPESNVIQFPTRSPVVEEPQAPDFDQWYELNVLAFFAEVGTLETITDEAEFYTQARRLQTILNSWPLDKVVSG